MPSLLHELLVQLFRERAAVAPELLGRLLAVDVPRFERAIAAESNLTQLLPTEYRADLVVLLEDERPVFGIVVEVQLKRDPDKAYAWPLYEAALRARHRCPVSMLVVCPDAAVARWAATPVELGPGRTWAPVVLGPAKIPWVTSPDDPDAGGELGALSLVAHAPDAGALRKIAPAVLGTLRGRHDARSRFYYDVILAALPEAARRELLAMSLIDSEDQYQSEHARRALAQAREEGKALERENARRALADVVRDLLSAHGFTLTPAHDRRIQEASAEQLRQWVRRSPSAASLDDVFRDE